MSNCKQCDKPIESHTGRRPKQFCDESCRNAYFNARKPKESNKVWKTTYDAVVSENNALKARIRELENGVPTLDRGSNGNGVSKETVVTETIEGKIEKLKAELASVTGKGSLANELRISIEKKINRLEKGQLS